MNSPHPSEDEIFERALLLAGEARAAYLKEASGGDEQLRQRIEALLQANESAGAAFLNEPAVVSAKTIVIATGTVPVPDKPGDKIGRYKLLEQIGEGGCGVVYVAEQEEPVRRRVALKVIKLGMDTKQVVARFEAERQALALMDHPNIAKVLDAGATDTGRPYFVMELVRGIKITDYCDKHNLSTEERLKLFIQVCSAIQHAHQKGIIHRDIKPSNILVTLHDGVPVPKVIDFGIAKATSDQRLTDKTIYTAFEQFIGTPAYMSPEQAEMSGLDIDTRSDIYSLGVLLYELLTGQTPFDAATLLKAGLDQMRRIIREEEPQRPSTRLSTLEDADLTVIASHRRAEPPKLVGLIRGDLDWIVMKSLEKDRTRRYETANGLAADLQRHLNNELVTACPPSTFYRFQKMVRRNKTGFIVAGTTAFCLIVALLLISVQAVRAIRAETVARSVLSVVADDWNQESKALIDNGKLPEAEIIVHKTIAMERQVADLQDLVTSLRLQGRAYLLAGKMAEAEKTFDEAVRLSDKVFVLQPQLSAVLRDDLDRVLLREEKFAQAEMVARESLNNREHSKIPVKMKFTMNEPADDWLSITNSWGKYLSESLLGAALLGQKRYAEAEPMLLSGYEGMVKHDDDESPEYLKHDIESALAGLISVYMVTGQSNKVAALRLTPVPLDFVSGIVLSENPYKPIGNALVRVSSPGMDMRNVRELRNGVFETRTSENGHFKVQVPYHAKISLNVFAQHYQEAAGIMAELPIYDNMRFPSNTNLTIWLKPALYVAGTVKDESGKPICGAEVMATMRCDTNANFFIVDKADTDTNEHFEIFNFRTDNVGFGEERFGYRGQLSISYPELLPSIIQNVYNLHEAERHNLAVTLHHGHNIKGILTSSTGAPVQETEVDASDENLVHKTAKTDAAGRFVIRGLPEGDITLRSHSLPLKQSVKSKITMLDEDVEVKLRLAPVVLKTPPKTITLFGMQIADVTPELQAAYELQFENGVITLETQTNSLAFGDKVTDGGCIWLVGEKRIRNIREMVSEILRINAVDFPGRPNEGCRDDVTLVYQYPFMGGNYTVHIHLTHAQVAELSKLETALEVNKAGQ